MFIIRNGNVTAVRSTSLPLGISCSSQSDITSFSLENKDIVLMVTDGITDGVKWKNKKRWGNTKGRYACTGCEGVRKLGL